MKLHEIKQKYCVDAGLDFKSRPYQIFIKGESKPFFSTENESRFNEQIKMLKKLAEEGRGTAYVAYKNGKPVPFSSVNGMQVAINREYAKRMRK